MAADKDAAKRRRQARNRQEREKRQTRVEGARRSGSARPARTSDGVAATGRKGGSSTAKTSQPPANPIGSGSLLGKLFPPRPAPTTAKGTGGRPARAQPTESVVYEVEEGAGARAWVMGRMSQPGGRAVLLALLVAIVSSITLLTTPVVRTSAFEYYGQEVVEASASSETERASLVEGFEEADPVGEGTARLLDVVPPLVALVYAVIPLLICGFAAFSLTRATRSRTLLIMALAAAMYLFFASFNSTFIVAVGALGFAAYQSRKADALAVAGPAEDDEEDGDDDLDEE